MQEKVTGGDAGLKSRIISLKSPPFLKRAREDAGLKAGRCTQSFWDEFPMSFLPTVVNQLEFLHFP